jgi:hypothetical protein
MAVAPALVVPSVEAIETLRTGLVVNWAFVLITAAFSAAHEFASASAQTAHDIWAAVWDDARTSISNVGFAFYLSAGSAFFGAVPFSRVNIRDHMFFTFVWAFFALLLIAIELAKARVQRGTSEGWTLSRIVAIPAGLAASVWVWYGASNLT